MVALIIIKDLVKVASHCFISKIILKHLKKFITIVLRKEEKKDYSLLSSYRLITFKNMLIKVLKKHVANIIFKAVKEHKLLP